jgi:hypothetical protein
VTTYCANAIKAIRLVGSDRLQFLVWHTGQVLTKPLSEIDGLDFEAIRKLRKEGKEFRSWYQQNA